MYLVITYYVEILIKSLHDPILNFIIIKKALEKI
jgi:hypothetical protein